MMPVDIRIPRTAWRRALRPRWTAAGCVSAFVLAGWLVGDWLPVARVHASAAPAATTLVDPVGRQERQERFGAPEVPTSALDQVLEVYVRDGLVYYRALESDRRGLDRYVAGLDESPETVARWDRGRRVAFWLNAYNAIVLRTVIDNYPIRGAATGFPANSIRQIAGTFDRRTWRVAGKAVTLDQIEQAELASFEDPRLLFAIGRGAIGSGRLRSEAFDAARLEEQLTDVMADCVRRVVCARVDPAGNALGVSPIFGWREGLVATAAGAGVAERYPGRSALEHAILSLVVPHLFASERDWLSKNTFKVGYEPFDWRLNDLTGGPPR